MKLIKAFGVMFFALTLMFLSSCTASFCSPTEEAAIKTELRVMLDANTGGGAYATPDDWSLKNDADKIKYTEDLYRNSHPKACLTLVDSTDPITGVSISAKNIGFAFSTGLIEGLFVYPIAFLMIQITNILGTNGWGQVLAIIIVTFFVKLIVTLATFKQTLASQKLQMLQPEITQVTAKYQGLTDPASKNKQAMEIMKIYSDNKVNPLASIIVPFLTLPIFIAIYGAVKDTMVLGQGSILGLNLSQTLSSGILVFNPFAVLIFAAMIGSQFLAMKLPMWVNRKKKNQYMDEKAKKANAQQQNIVYIMMLTIVFVGWVLPVAMTVYWIASSLFVVIQTLATRKLMKAGA
jgi:YidC/Oxa1 family membrane protein insertase